MSDNKGCKKPKVVKPVPPKKLKTIADQQQLIEFLIFDYLRQHKAMRGYEAPFYHFAQWAKGRLCVQLL